MADSGYYSQELHGPYETFDLGDFPLGQGGTLRGAQLAYATFGTLSANKDNAILIPTWYTGTSKIMEQVYIGAGRALDPEKYFIIIVNQFGSGLSSSPSNTPLPFNKSRFPHVRICDDVRAQHKLVTEKFGITELALVVGASMGAQQTYEWAVRYPEMVLRAAPMTGTAKNTPHIAHFAQSNIDAMASDPAWHGGWYADSADVHIGLKRHAQIFPLLALSPEFFKQEVWRTIGFSSIDDFQIGFIEGYFLPMDPNNLMTQAWKWKRGDVSRHTGGDLAAALGRIKAKTFVMPIDHDMIFPVADCSAEAALIPNAELRVLPSIWGHLGLFGFEPDYIAAVDANLNELLAAPVKASNGRATAGAAS